MQSVLLPSVQVANQGNTGKVELTFIHTFCRGGNLKALMASDNLPEVLGSFRLIIQSYFRKDFRGNILVISLPLPPRTITWITKGAIYHGWTTRPSSHFPMRCTCYCCSASTMMILLCAIAHLQTPLMLVLDHWSQMPNSERACAKGEWYTQPHPNMSAIVSFSFITVEAPLQVKSKRSSSIHEP